MSALAGIRVIEVATYVFGPAAATVMSDFGAEVIKVERPGLGDPYRYLSYLHPMPEAPLNYCWLLDGRNKRSIALDLSDPAGRDALLRLVATADVFVTNYQPATLEKLRLAYADLAELNARLVYAHATGYGTEGEESEKPGYDMTAYWARSGLMDSVRSRDAEPCMLVTGMGDHPSAMALFGAVMLGLYRRERTGLGSLVSTSLMANGAWANSCMIQAALCTGGPWPLQARSGASNPLVNHYVTGDGKRFMFCLVQAEKDWPNLCAALGREDLAGDPRFATTDARGEHASDLVALLDAALAERTLEEWSGLFARHDLAWGPVSTNAEVALDAQMAANGVFAEIEHPTHGPVRTVTSPIEVRGAPKVKPRLAPEVGQDTVEVLASLGYDDAAIRGLLERGAAQQGPGPAPVARAESARPRS